MNGLLLGHATGVWSCVSSLSSCLAPAPSIARLQSKPQRRDVDSRDRTCMQRHWCVATRRKRAVLCCAAWCRGFLINKRRAAVVDCSIFANSRHGPGALRPFARALRNRGAQTWPFSRDRNQRHALRFFLLPGRKGLAPALEHAAAIPPARLFAVFVVNSLINYLFL